jgi:hypothetical protein
MRVAYWMAQFNSRAGYRHADAVRAKSQTFVVSGTPMSATLLAVDSVFAQLSSSLAALLHGPDASGRHDRTFRGEVRVSAIADCCFSLIADAASV